MLSEIIYSHVNIECSEVVANQEFSLECKGFKAAAFSCCKTIVDLPFLPFCHSAFRCTRWIFTPRHARFRFQCSAASLRRIIADRFLLQRSHEPVERKRRRVMAFLFIICPIPIIFISLVNGTRKLPLQSNNEKKDILLRRASSRRSDSSVSLVDSSSPPRLFF